MDSGRLKTQDMGALLIWGMATHSSILAWKILWTEEPGGLQPRGLQRVRHDLASKQHLYHCGQYSWRGKHSTAETDSFQPSFLGKLVRMRSWQECPKQSEGVWRQVLRPARREKGVQNSRQQNSM